MALTISDHSVAAWQSFAKAAQFVPDPMIIRAGEVFANGSKGVTALNTPDMDVQAALCDNIDGLIAFFDLLVAYDQVPLINYNYTYDIRAMPAPITDLLGAKALPVTIGYEAYRQIKIGAVASLAAMNLGQIAQFGHQLAELKALRYDWRPSLEDVNSEGWLSEAAQLNEPTREAAQFLLGGLIFSGFAQASLTEHIIQPKRSRFFLALTAAQPIISAVTHADENSVFTAAEMALRGTAAKTHRLDALPPVLPYLLAKAPANVTSADLLKRALDFSNTRDGDNFRKAVALVRGDGVGASQTADLAKAAKAEALALLKPYSTVADTEGGLRLDFNLELTGPSVTASLPLKPPAWLKLWWNENVPFGGLRKTFRRMWLAKESFDDLQKRLIAAWSQP